jgi:acylphosphatase
MISAKIDVEGRVQGVWFRDYVRRSAEELGLKGWVKNNPDGSVSLEVEGDKKVINMLVEKINIGSPLSKVDRVNIEWFDFRDKYELFKIIR